MNSEYFLLYSLLILVYIFQFLNYLSAVYFIYYLLNVYTENLSKVLVLGLLLCSEQLYCLVLLGSKYLQGVILINN